MAANTIGQGQATTTLPTFVHHHLLGLGRGGCDVAHPHLAILFNLLIDRGRLASVSVRPRRNLQHEIQRDRRQDDKSSRESGLVFRKENRRGTLISNESINTQSMELAALMS